MKTQLSILWIFLFLQESYSDFKDNFWYPRYHLASLDGFMNDPNGMIFYDGYYHAFYQHTPHDTSPGGLKHWAHASSENMLVWEHLDEALTPSIKEDMDGCFSGSAVLDDKGNLFLIYTGVSTVGNRTHQVQCLAYESYGFKKEGKIIESNTYYENFRDPKAWKQGDTYYVVIGAMNESSTPSRGQVMLYKSLDLKNWEPQGILAGPLNNTGFMWECPDLYTLNDKQILSFSIQEETNSGTGYRSGYLVGAWTPGQSFKIEQSFTDFDKGNDFYASQTFLAKDGRRIQVAWMNMWDTPFPEAKDGWVGCLTLPRELTLNDQGILLANPIEEIKALRGDLEYHLALTLFEDQKLFRLGDEQYLTIELEIEWDLENSTATEFGLKLDGGTQGEGFYIFVMKSTKQLVLRRNYPQYGFPLTDRFIPIDISSTLYTRIFFDFSTVEVFINHGETVMSSRIYPNGDQRQLSLFTVGGNATFKNLREWSIVAQ